MAFLHSEHMLSAVNRLGQYVSHIRKTLKVNHKSVGDKVYF